MRKFNPYTNQQQSTNQSSNSRCVTPKASREKYVSPFPFHRCASPLQTRLANSPLHVPLAIALKKLVSAGDEKSYEQSSSHISPFSAELDNIKNVLQEFAESLYFTLERELYAKFNVEMKRIILKSRETERILTKIQQKITAHSDILQLEKIFKAQIAKEKSKIEGLESQNHGLYSQLTRATQQIDKINNDKLRMERENNKLKETVEKLENILLRKMQEKQNNINASNIQPQPHQGKYSLASRARPAQTPISEEKSSFWEHSSQSTTSVTNVNQILPSQSPVHKRKVVKVKQGGGVNKDMSPINIKKCYF